MQLEELVQPVTDVRGVGPQSKADLAKLGIRRVRDLLLHVPRAWEDRSTLRSFKQALSALKAEGFTGPELSSDFAAEESSSIAPGWVNTIATVTAHERHGGVRSPLRIRLVDKQGDEAVLLCFNRDFLARSLPVGLNIRVCGKAEFRYHELQLSVFDTGSTTDDGFDRVLPIYPLGGKLNQGFFRRVIPQALSAYTPGLGDCLPLPLREQKSFVSRREALVQLHVPKDPDAMLPARERMVYEELFLLQVQLAQATLKRKGAEAFRVQTVKEHSNKETVTLCPLSQSLLAALPFKLTDGQRQAINDILVDFKAPYSMSRLLQGDVGCGKTLVALVAALEAIHQGYQAAIMVPTVLLARQHAERAASLFEPLGVSVALVAGTITASTRSPMLDAIAKGEAKLIIGTHGLFTPAMRYHNLGLVVIDEQHRFGVNQRQALYEKAAHPHLLMMSATPIPQTLALTAFGDMDVSVVHTMPVGRKPIETHLTRIGNEQKVYDWVRRELDAGRQAYFVYPLITEGEDPELKSVETMAETLTKIFPERRIGLIHAKLPDDQKGQVMHAFSSGELDILVATSVVEVGVDVPNATCMVIEHAERFGLAALHQLRGRVGRGVEQSYCFLVYSEPLTDEGKMRLRALKESSDGFLLAEKDLEIRGPGDMRGLQQSGFIRLRFAHLVRDLPVMRQARADAVELLRKDPTLEAPVNLELRQVLELVRKEEDPLVKDD